MIEPVRKCLVVLGMHRSGTSALAGSLQIMGVDMGSEHLEAMADNPKGFFEHKGIVGIDEAVLDTLGSSWDNPFMLADGWWAEDGLDSHKVSLQELIEKEFGNSALFGFKDPRISRLLPLWKDIFAKSEISAKYIILLRNPLEIARSLKKRNGFSEGKAMLIWAAYMLDAELYTRDFPRVFISYDDFLRNPVSTLDAISKRLGIEFPRNTSAVLPELVNFLELSLRHHSFTVEDVKAQAWRPLAEFFSVLTAIAERGVETPEQREWLDLFRKDYRMINQYFDNEIGPVKIREMEIRAERLEAEKLELEDALTRIIMSAEWDVFRRYYDLRDRLFPVGSRRRSLMSRFADCLLRR